MIRADGAAAVAQVLRAHPTAPRGLRQRRAPEGHDPGAQAALQPLRRDVRCHKRGRDVHAPLGLAAVPIDLALVNPGWVGFSCLDQTIPPPIMSVGGTTNGRFETVVSIPRAARGGLLGTNIGWWGVGLDFATGNVSATGCSVTAF